jgi:ATP-dependent Clp protease, protease subunit
MNPAAPLQEQVRSSLFARRVVLVHGTLDDASASEAAAALMTLDALGDEHVELRLQSCAGSIEAAFVLIDIIDVLGVPVHTTALGLAGGGAVGVFALGARRLIAPHARLHLREPDIEVTGRAGEFERSAAEHRRRREQFRQLLADRTGRSKAEIDDEWEDGRYLDAPTALAARYADALGV